MIIEIVNCVISTLGFIAICVEIALMNNEQKNHIKELKIQEAISLSDKFKNLISNNLNFILGALENDNYLNIINEVPEDELRIFDADEFNSLVKKYPKLKVYDDLNNYIFNKNFNAISSSYLAYSDVSKEEYNKIKFFEYKKWMLSEEERKLLEQKEDSKEKEKLLVYYNEMCYFKEKIAKEFFGCITDTLNELEELCMALNKGIVDESTVYQSLHQIVIRSIKYFYPEICMCNKHNNTYDKYYTHTITLYNNWSKRRNEEKKNEIEKRNIVHKSSF